MFIIANSTIAKTFNGSTRGYKRKCSQKIVPVRSSGIISNMFLYKQLQSIADSRPPSATISHYFATSQFELFLQVGNISFQTSEYLSFGGISGRMNLFSHISGSQIQVPFLTSDSDREAFTCYSRIIYLRLGSSKTKEIRQIKQLILLLHCTVMSCQRLLELQLCYSQEINAKFLLQKMAVHFIVR